MKLASPKLDTSHLSRDEEALSRCEIALEQRDNENPQGALDIMRPLWHGVGTLPDTQGLQPETAADVVLCAGILTGWIGARNQIKDAQENARDLITRSITYYDSNNLIREAAEAWSEIAYCYWREGRVNEARIMLQEALERLPPKGLKRARALLKLVDVEHSASRYYDALNILTDNHAVFTSIKYLPVKASYHNELAMTFEEIAVADKRPDYFQRALQAIAQARLGKQARTQLTLQRAIEIAHEADALNKAGLAALTIIEEVDGLSPDTLQAAYQQAREWLADSQSREVHSRLSAAAGKLAASLRREMSRDEAVDVLLTKPLDLDQTRREYEQKQRECEHDQIEQALVQADGSVVHAARLIGKTYQGLTWLIANKYPDLLKKRSPIRRRTRKKKKTKTRR